MLRQIVLDTETTGLSPEKGDRMIEIGALEMINRRLTGKQYHYYINPEREIDQEAEAVHGISSAFLADKPVFADIVDSFIEFVGGSELVIHNASFDVGFINHELKLLKRRFRPIDQMCSVLDTLAVARQKHPGQPNSLDALCRRYHVNNANRELHGALLDAGLLSQVYLLMTGGQERLFQFESQANSSEEKVTESLKRVTLERLPLSVIHANAKELADHQQFLDKVLCADS